MQIFALQDDMAKELNNLFNISNSKVINNGIDFNLFKKNTEWRNEARKKLGLSDDCFLIGHVGRFTKQKNQKFLLKVFQKILEEKENVHLLMIGAGEDKGIIDEKIKSNHLTSKVTILSNRSDIPQLMNAMDVFVFPSVFEGFGIVLVEAQAIGLKCVVSEEVSDYACLTFNINKLSLNESLDAWKDRILGYTWEETNYSGIEEFDINQVVKELELYYMGDNLK